MKVFVIGGTTSKSFDGDYQSEIEILASAMKKLGRDIIEAGHDLVVCSPYPGSADFEAVCGAAEATDQGGSPVIEFHYPQGEGVSRELKRLIDSLSLAKATLFSHLPPAEDSPEAWKYAWILAQLVALDRSNVIVAIGGNLTGSSNLLLPLAEEKRKMILPLTFLGGAAEQSFFRRRYELVDRFHDRVTVLNDADRVGEVVSLLDELTNECASKSKGIIPQRFFISYPRSRPQEADFVEMILRRRNLTVFRDERDFGAGCSISGEINEYIFQAEVFVILWCKEYACSPWCFDELELALARHKNQQLTLWIFCVDDTRIVPPAARQLITYPIRTREELEGRVLSLLESFVPSEA